MSKINRKKTNIGRDSLVVQWLRLCTPNAGVSSSITGQGIRSYMLPLKKSHMPQLKDSVRCNED